MDTKLLKLFLQIFAFSVTYTTLLCLSQYISFNILTHINENTNDFGTFVVTAGLQGVIIVAPIITLIHVLLVRKNISEILSQKIISNFSVLTIFIYLFVSFFTLFVNMEIYNNVTDLPKLPPKYVAANIIILSGSLVYFVWYVYPVLCSKFFHRE